MNQLPAIIKPASAHLNHIARSALRFGVLILMGTTLPQLSAQTENFNDGNDSAPVYWQHYSLPAQYYGATTYAFPDDEKGGKAYSLTAAPTGADPYGLKNARGASFPALFGYTNRFYMATDLLAWSTVGRPNVGLMWYVHDVGLGKTDGYVATYSHAYGNLYISIATNEAQEAYFCRLDDGTTKFDPTNRIRLTASSHDGYTFVFTAYNLLEPETPWASVIGLDTTWFGVGGYSGYIVMNEDYPADYGVSATFDNYAANEPAAGTMPAIVTDVYPPPAGSTKETYVKVTNSIVILDRDTTVEASSILLCLDGAWIQNAELTIDPVVYKQYNPSSRQQYFNGATVTYPIPGLLPPGTKHTNVVVFRDGSTWYTNKWSWTASYRTFYATNGLPLGTLTVPGFDVRVAQTTNNGNNLPNTLERARQQLAGLIPVDQRATSIVQVLNWNETSAYPDNVPGLCPVNLANIAAESCAYLELTAGPHRFHINTDDRAGLYSGPGFGELNSTTIWEASGMVNTTFEFWVESAGLYPVRCLWEETGGAAKLSLYSVDWNDSTETLINDPGNPAGVVKAYYPVVCQSSASLTGPFRFAPNAANTLNISDQFSTVCQTVTGRNVTGGTLTIPLSAEAQFYRLETARKAKITHIGRSGANVEIHYQFN